MIFGDHFVLNYHNVCLDVSSIVISFGDHLLEHFIQFIHNDCLNLDSHDPSGDQV